MLLDSGGGFVAGELLDVSGDVYRLDAGQGQAAVLAPREEIAYRFGVGSPGVAVADRGGKELDEASACCLAGVGNDGGQDRAGSWCR